MIRGIAIMERVERRHKGQRKLSWHGKGVGTDPTMTPKMV
jgi:hypothetical protein